MARQQAKACFLLYIDDWLSSQQIDMMDADEERGYLRLLMAAWKNDDCGLPDDDAELAVKSKLGPQWWKESKDKTKRISGSTSGAKVRKCFFIESGRLYNERQLEERRYQEAVRENRSSAGKKGNEARWGSDRKVIASGSQTASQNDPNIVSGLCLGLDSQKKELQPETKSKKTAPLLDNFGEFVAECQSAGIDGSETDWKAAVLEWNSIDFEMKLHAVEGIRARLRDAPDDFALKSLPQNYLKKRMWQRPIRQSQPSRPEVQIKRVAM